MLKQALLSIVVMILCVAAFVAAERTLLAIFPDLFKSILDEQRKHQRDGWLRLLQWELYQ